MQDGQRERKLDHTINATEDDSCFGIFGLRQLKMLKILGRE